MDTDFDTIYGLSYFGAVYLFFILFSSLFVELSRQLCASQKSDDPKWRLE